MAADRFAAEPAESTKPPAPMMRVAVTAQGVAALLAISLAFGLLRLLGLLDRPVVMWVVCTSCAATVAVVVSIIGLAPMVRRFKRAMVHLDAVAAGDLTGRLPVTSRDEFGLIAEAINRATETLDTMVTAMATSANTLVATSKGLSGCSERFSASATRVVSEAETVLASAGTASTDIEMLATGSEEMTASIGEIARSAAEVAAVAAAGVETTRTANEIAAQLRESSDEIGAVMRTITAIADQTNLLALNATIEAARAGESGKGFAVVAGEVKDLAQSAAKATEQIAGRVATLQADSAHTAQTIDQIGGIISQISEHQLAIASATDEQATITAEMTGRAAAAANASAQITAAMRSMESSARATHTDADDARCASEELLRVADGLNRLAAKYQG